MVAKIEPTPPNGEERASLRHTSIRERKSVLVVCSESTALQPGAIRSTHPAFTKTRSPLEGANIDGQKPPKTAATIPNGTAAERDQELWLTTWPQKTRV